MSLAEKLKECRKKAGLSQEQLAEKLCVSRQAITKWESDKGTPDIGNIQSIARLFGVSIDYLLDNGEALSNTIIKESINISEYEKTGKCRSKYDAVVKVKYPKATVIYPLIRRKKLSFSESIVDFIVMPGTLDLADSISNISSYYLVELENKQILVNVTKEFIESSELNYRFTEKKCVIGKNIFIKASYIL